MLKREDRIKHPAYWLESIQNELYRQLEDYMETEGLNRTRLASKWNVTKGYISQILNGNFNLSLGKFIELSLRIGKVPVISFVPFNTYLKQQESSSKKYEPFPDFAAAILAEAPGSDSEAYSTPRKRSFPIVNAKFITAKIDKNKDEAEAYKLAG